MPPRQEESTKRGAAREFDLLSAINGYPEIFSVFQGEPLTLRIARKPGQFLSLPRLLVRALWHFPLTAALRDRQLQRRATRSVMHPRKPAAPVTRIAVHDRVKGALVRDHALAAPATIFAEVPASHKDEGGNYTGSVLLDTNGWPASVCECVVHDKHGRASEDIYVNLKPRTLENIDLLCILPSFTWQAYNRIGGGSFYSPELGYVRTICSQRPMRHLSDNSILPSLAVLSTFHRAGIRVACVDSWDMHHGLVPAGDVPVAAVLVHDEYWSAPMRAQIDRLLDRGTALLVLSGNTCWWRINVDGPNISVCKEPRRRALWHFAGLPEEQTFVSSFRFAGYAIERAKQKSRLQPRIAHLTKEEVYEAGAITVVEPDHPLFAGVTLKNGRSFGHDVPVVYRELDAVPLSADGTVNRRLYLAPNLAPRVLATGLALYGKNLRRVGLVVEADVRNGYVLHMGSIGWSRGVSQNHEGVKRILINAYEHCRVKGQRIASGKRKNKDEGGC